MLKRTRPFLVNLLAVYGRILSFLLISSLLASCKKENQPAVPLTIKDKASFYVGAAVQASQLKNADFSLTLSSNFSQVTAEYEMKMGHLWTSLQSYNWTNADFIVSYAAQRGLNVHGHTLLWYQSFPAWFKNAGYDSLHFENNVKAYIQAVVSRYAGKIAVWDVANEIFADDGSLRNDGIVTVTFRDPLAFYGRCFQYARQADPSVKLFYNDYDIVLNQSKRSAVKAMISRFRRDGYPIDGIGEQCHTTVWTDKVKRRTGFTDLAGTGLLIHISELDVRVNQYKSDSYIFSSGEQQKQSDTYKDIVLMYEDLPREQKYAITTWGLSDKSTWITGWWHPLEYPLLFDENYLKKKAYSGFLEALR